MDETQINEEVGICCGAEANLSRATGPEARSATKMDVRLIWLGRVWTCAVPDIESSIELAGVQNTLRKTDEICGRSDLGSENLVRPASRSRFNFQVSDRTRCMQGNRSRLFDACT